MKNKTNSGNFFEDFFVGQELKHSTPRTISSGDVSLFIGLLGSRFVLHSSKVSMLNLEVAFKLKIAQIDITSEVSVPSASANSKTLKPFTLL